MGGEIVEFNGHDLFEAVGKYSNNIMNSLKNARLPYIQKQILIKGKRYIVNCYKFDKVLEHYKNKKPRTKVEKLAWERIYETIKNLQESMC